MSTVPLLEVDDLSVVYGSRRRSAVKAVDGVSLDIRPGETVGLVGESGSGKSSIGAATLGLVPAAAGHIRFDGTDITHASARDRRAMSADMQVIFQDPYGSLNSARTIYQTLVEPLIVHRSFSRSEARTAVQEALVRVGLDPSAADRYPRQFSGGQRQRIVIARALMIEPRLVICDEAVSALDLSVQAQVLNLLLSLQGDLSLSYLFISHDLAVVRHMCQRIVVLYRGRVMESGTADAVCSTPGHPYTQALLRAIPVPDPEEQRRRRLAHLTGTVGSQRVPSPEGCPFVQRCPLATDVCSTTRPKLSCGPTGSLVACHRREEVPALWAAESA
jgi:oligopeptide/dipeptide ABC transporter ATP-binding protein